MHFVLAILVVVIYNCVVESHTSYCLDIPNRASTERYVSQHGEPKNISLYWDSEPARAAASLLAAILRHVRGYKYVQLQHSSFQNHKSEAVCHLNGEMKEIKLELSTAQNTSNIVVSLEVKLQVHLAKHLQNEEQWAKVTKWNFYNGTTDLTNYGFSYFNTSGNLSLEVFIIEPHEPNVKAMAQALTARTNPFLRPLRLKEISMADSFNTLRNQNQSFLYLGYTMWADDDYMRIVESPIQLTTANIAMHVVDDCLLKELALEIAIIAKNYKLSTEQLRELLEFEVSLKNNEEAACKWISKHNTDVDSLVQEYDPNFEEYLIVIKFCKDNTEQEDMLNDFFWNLGQQINQKYEQKNMFFHLKYDGDNCSDTNYLMENLLKNNDITPLTIGVILDGVRNVKEYNVAKALNGIGAPVLVCNAADIDVEETTSVWLTSGRTLHLVLALHQLITANSWMRLVVLSDTTPTAERYIAELTQLGGLQIFHHKVERNLKQLEVVEILRNLNSNNTIFVNTNYVDAVTILLAVDRINNNGKHKFTCIVRDWQPNESTKNITHFTISNSYSDVKNNSILGKLHEPKGGWPAQATALTDAILVLLHGFENVIETYSQARHDTISNQVIKEFERSLNNQNGIEGVFQNLTFKGHSVEEIAVYLDEWHGDQHKRRARWSVNTTSLAATVEWGSSEISRCNQEPERSLDATNRSEFGSCNKNTATVECGSIDMLMTFALFCVIQNYSFI